MGGGGTYSMGGGTGNGNYPFGSDISGGTPPGLGSDTSGGTPPGSDLQNDPGQSPWGNPFGITQNGPGSYWTGGAPLQQQQPGIGPAYNHITGGTPLLGYQGGPNRNYNQQAGAWQWNQGFGYQGGPNRNFNQQTNKWQWNG